MWQARPIRAWPAARQDAGYGWHDLAEALKISAYGTLATPSSAQRQISILSPEKIEI